MRKKMCGVWVASVCLLYCLAGLSQVSPPTILKIDIENYVFYVNDVTDNTRLGTDPNLTTPSPPRPFQTFVFVGDIAAVNGKPAKGTWTARVTNIGLTPQATSGSVWPNSSIADTVRQNILDMYFEVLQPDGRMVGTIAASGLTRGSPPPGAPLAQTGDSLCITGGTGAFLGVRGQVGVIQIVTARGASAREDPANRRANGGGTRSYVLHLIPMSRPEITLTASGPAVLHSSDFSLVTAARPARAGEILTLYATGLGPTRPGVDPGAPFPASPLALVNSPVEVTINGIPAEVLYAGGHPGAVDGYQVNFRVSSGITPGMAAIQITSGFIPGPEARIPLQ